MKISVEHTFESAKEARKFLLFVEGFGVREEATKAEKPTRVVTRYRTETKPEAAPAYKSSVDEVLEFIDKNVGVAGITSAELEKQLPHLCKGKNKWYMSQTLFVLANGNKVDRINISGTPGTVKRGRLYRYFKKGTLAKIMGGHAETFEKKRKAKTKTARNGDGTKEVKETAMLLAEEAVKKGLTGFTVGEVVKYCNPKILSKYTRYFPHQVIGDMAKKGVFGVIHGERQGGRGWNKVPNVYFLKSGEEARA